MLRKVEMNIFSSVNYVTFRKLTPTDGVLILHLFEQRFPEWILFLFRECGILVFNFFYLHTLNLLFAYVFRMKKIWRQLFRDTNQGC
jgi:hypothetical protein